MTAHEPPGTELLAAVARGVIDLTGIRPSAFRLPYPASLQLALDRVVLESITRRTTVPRSVPELLTWCRERAPMEWLFLPRDFLTPGARLIHPTADEPTRTCAELASLGRHGALEQEAQSLLSKLADTCGSPARFAQCRDFLIRRPVVLRFDPMELLQPSLANTWRLVKDLYGPVPDHYPADGLVHCCSGCGLLAKTDTAGGRWCEGGCLSEDLKLDASHQPGKALVLPLALRLFLSLPGRTELEVRARLGDRSAPLLAVLGIHRIPGRNGEPLDYQVQDREQPIPAAQRAAEAASGLDGQLNVVVPDDRTRSPVYRQAFELALPPGARVRLRSVSEFTASEPTDGTRRGHA
ncbi:hypothetical protein ACFV4G_20510 [Kitasatospora sp. NPDC059747]|uniref:pPIWI_RE_Y domain-containing protein n=1 Tax=Kitasatospora sp. NPDC059747 TaxID=3346930 RepID=UPI00364C1698